MDEKTSIKVTVIPFVWIYTIVVAAIMWIITQDFMVWPFCFILGSVVSLFNFSLLVNYVKKTKPEDLKKGMFLNYLIRFIMYGIVLGTMFYAKGTISLIPTGLGCLSLKIVLFFYTLINRGEKI